MKRKQEGSDEVPRRRGRPPLNYQPGDLILTESGVLGRYRKPVPGSWGRSLLIETEMGLLAAPRGSRVFVLDPAQFEIDFDTF